MTPSELVPRLRAAGCVFAEDEAALLLSAAGDTAELEALTARRVAGEPLEQVVGWAELCGVRTAVVPGVFVPRRRSELLVREAVSGAAEGAVVVDLCCGNGAVGRAVVGRLSRFELHASDVDPVAVACARRNLADVGGSVHEGDLDAALPPSLRARVDVLVVNAPYVPTGELALMPREALLFEPRRALDGGPDGVAVHRRVAAAAPRWLSPGGHLLVETSARQAALTAAAFRAAGLAPRVVTDDDLEATVVVGTVVGTAGTG